ncbi:MAG: hypothetical protein ACE5GH_00950 [Fidelibacterota bacterium]
MRRLEVVVLSLSILSFLTGQTPYNSILHGVVLDQLDAPSVSLGTTGLVPSHNSTVSLANPATWTDLKFAFLSAHFSGGDVQVTSRDFNSEFGHLGYATFIVPIKGEFAGGLGLRPYSRKEFSLKDDSVDTVIFSGDTLTLSKELEGSGGISSLFTAASWKIHENLTLGVRLEFLLGVFDEVTTTDLSETRAVYRRHFQYKGTMLSVFFRSTRFQPSMRSTVHLGLQFPVGDRRILETDYHSYIAPVAKSPQKFALPVAVLGGWVYDLSPHTHLSLEVLGREFGDSSSLLNTLPGRSVRASRAGLGLLREAVPGSRRLVDRLHYRVGFFRRQHYISRRESVLQESGWSLGIGISFGLTRNQIDVGFRSSRREGFLSNDIEHVREVIVGLTIGDVWFVRRTRR